MRPVGIGIIGCGNISAAYLKNVARLPMLEVAGVADLLPELAQARGREFGVPALEVARLLADPAVEIVVNLTIPQAHVAVALAAIAAGKHTYSEKPLAVTLAEAGRLLETAERAGLRVGCAPDTFLGAGQQTARRAIDEGAIGAAVGGTAFFMCPGHERWHPNPAFYYAKGGGPLLDMGPYYITAIVNLLGPVARVSGTARMTRSTRTITSQPRAGSVIPVEVTTHVTGTLELVSGALVGITMSFDVPRHRHLPIEIYGTEASLTVPDPNHFGGMVERAPPAGEWAEIAQVHGYATGNWRLLGVAEMAVALRRDRPHRASAELAFHVLEVMAAIGAAAETGRHVTVTSRAERPAAMAVGLADGELD